MTIFFCSHSQYNDVAQALTFPQKAYASTVKIVNSRHNTEGVTPRLDNMTIAPPELWKTFSSETREHFVSKLVAAVNTQIPQNQNYPLGTQSVVRQYKNEISGHLTVIQKIMAAPLDEKKVRLLWLQSQQLLAKGSLLIPHKNKTGPNHHLPLTAHCLRKNLLYPLYELCAIAQTHLPPLAIQTDFFQQIVDGNGFPEMDYEGNDAMWGRASDMSIDRLDAVKMALIDLSILICQILYANDPNTDACAQKCGIIGKKLIEEFLRGRHKLPMLLTIWIPFFDRFSKGIKHWAPHIFFDPFLNQHIIVVRSRAINRGPISAERINLMMRADGQESPFKKSVEIEILENLEPILATWVHSIVMRFHVARSQADLLQKVLSAAGEKSTHDRPALSLYEQINTPETIEIEQYSLLYHEYTTTLSVIWLALQEYATNPASMIPLWLSWNGEELGRLSCFTIPSHTPEQTAAIYKLRVKQAIEPYLMLTGVEKPLEDITSKDIYPKKLNAFVDLLGNAARLGTIMLWMEALPNKKVVDGLTPSDLKLLEDRWLLWPMQPFYQKRAQELLETENLHAAFLGVLQMARKIHKKELPKYFDPTRVDVFYDQTKQEFCSPYLTLLRARISTHNRDFLLEEFAGLWRAFDQSAVVAPPSSILSPEDMADLADAVVGNLSKIARPSRKTTSKQSIAAPQTIEPADPSLRPNEASAPIPVSDPLLALKAAMAPWLSANPPPFMKSILDSRVDRWQSPFLDINQAIKDFEHSKNNSTKDFATMSTKQRKSEWAKHYVAPIRFVLESETLRRAFSFPYEFLQAKNKTKYYGTAVFAQLHYENNIESGAIFLGTKGMRHKKIYHARFESLLDKKSEKDGISSLWSHDSKTDYVYTEASLDRDHLPLAWKEESLNIPTIRIYLEKNIFYELFPVNRFFDTAIPKLFPAHTLKTPSPEESACINL